jgi:hypothetical protein
MAPFSFCRSLWTLTLAGYMVPPCKMVQLDTTLPSWWPPEKTELWEALRKSEQLASLPSIRRGPAMSEVFLQCGLSAFQPQRPGLAPPPLTSEFLPFGGQGKGKRAASTMAETDSPEDMNSAAQEDWDRWPKRVRSQDPDGLYKLFSVTMSLRDGPPQAEIGVPDINLVSWATWDFDSSPIVATASKRRKGK